MNDLLATPWSSEQDSSLVFSHYIYFFVYVYFLLGISLLKKWGQ